MRKLLLLVILATSASGCAGDNCFRPNGMGVNSQGCKEYRATHAIPAKPSVEWYEYLVFPLLFVADSAGKATDLNSSVTNSEHYRAGGSAARDYVEKP